jgi:hypothetical protein
MERNFYTDDFERLIRQKADQYKMYPSDQVWKGIYKSLHGRGRWRWAGLAILLLSIGVYTGNYYLSDKPAAKLANNIQSSISATTEFPEHQFTPERWINPITKAGVANNNVQQSTAVNTIARNSQLLIADNGITTAYSTENSQIIINAAPEAFISNTESEAINVDQKLTQKQPSTLAAEPTGAEKSLTTFADASSESVLKENKQQGINWLEEYAVFQLTPAKQKRIGLQIHFSPTVNYRKLSGSNFYTSEVKNIPLAPNIVGDVDQYVKHRPALGFELGTNLMYRTSRHVTLKAGLQFNYSRYEIEAYSAPIPEIATIALNNQTFINDTISRYSRIRNLSGYEQENLSNQYFQLSLPIGIEYRVLGTGRLQLNVAGTIQPTYLLNKNSYLITTDFKNYTREPSLVRRWNVNGGLEAYVSYYTGSVRWQIGPQFRYQLLSTYSRKYPIKEQLMEYGFKVGVSKTIR